MGNKILNILTYLMVIITIVSILYIGLNKYLLNHQNLRFQHPCPKLTKEFPILKEFDRVMMFTACVVWNMAIEKHTGKKYLVHIKLSQNLLNPRKIYLMDYENRNRFILMPEKQYKNHFWEI